jgi:hypothetical protein
MKNDLRKQVSDLLNGSNKQEYLFAVISTPGVYSVNGKNYNEPEFIELSKGYETVIKWHETKTYEKPA